MNLRQSAKNSMGNVLGYGRCPVTGDTYWNSDVVSVYYNSTQGVALSRRALTEHTPEEVAKVVFERGKKSHGLGRMYTLEEITEAIRSGNVMTFPRK